ncbi:MAG: PAS domain-containing protein [Candidatus Eisenbacteria bacterium]|nr:PAS domain-containing protein [Candidatus Eisenbacteria bacterium]
MSHAVPTTRSIIAARLVVAALTALGALVGGRQVDSIPVIILGIIAALLSGVYAAWSRVQRDHTALLRIQFAVDIVFVTLVVYFSGGLASPFKLLYFLPVIVSSARLGFRDGVGIAAGAVIGHVVLMFVDPVQWASLYAQGALAEIATLVVSFLLVAMLVGYLSERAAVHARELAVTRSELDTANLRLSNIIDSLGSGLALVDSDGHVIYLNRAGASILGVPESASHGRDYRLVFADVPAFCERLAAALEAGRPETRVDFHVRRRGGGSTPVGLSTSILRDDDGNERGVVAIFQDLTEARRLEERLRHDDRLSALGQFAAGLAHEIRNPLNAIRGSIEMLGEDAEPESQHERLVGLVMRETDRLQKLVQDVLQYGRMESGERDRIRLDELVHEVALLVTSQASYRPEIELVEEAPEPVEGTVNEEEMRRALLNLTLNAVEAIDGSGRVRLSVVREDEYASRGLEGSQGSSIAIIVEDTGDGIPSDKRDEIFQPFRTTKKGGTGLGLAIVDRIVQSHGGRITVASEVGRGSRFVIYLPD